MLSAKCAEMEINIHMVDMHSMIDLQITIFLLMIAGYVMTKLKILPPESKKPLTDLVIDFVLPCNIIVSFMIDMNREVLVSCFAVLCASIVIQIFSAFAGRYFYPVKDKDTLAVLRYGTICSNAGFIGNPVIHGLYGAQGLLYASIYLIPQRIVMWSAGVSCFTTAKGKDVIKKVITHPCIIAVFVGFVLMLVPFDLPSGIVKTLQTASSCTTGLSMIVIGHILAGIDIRTIVSRLNIYYCFIRLIVFPLLVLAGCRLLALDTLVTSVCVVLSGMPAGATTAILAAKYDGNEQFAVKIVFLSTILSLFTIPLLCVIMQYFL